MTAPPSRSGESVGSKTETRQNMWGLSAYFARSPHAAASRDHTPLVAKYIVSEVATGEYHLNTTTGNRVARQPINGVSELSRPAIPSPSGTASGRWHSSRARTAVRPSRGRSPATFNFHARLSITSGKSSWWRRSSRPSNSFRSCASGSEQSAAGAVDVAADQSRTSRHWPMVSSEQVRPARS